MLPTPGANGQRYTNQVPVGVSTTRAFESRNNVTAVGLLLLLALFQR